MDRGYIKVFRKLEDSSIFINPELLQLWIYCLMRASHEKRYLKITTGKGETEVLLEKGQFLFGRKKVAGRLCQKETSTYKRLLKLKKLGNIDIQSDTHYSIITICNWEFYQNTPKEKEQAKEHPSDNQGTGKEQPSDTNNHLKHLNHLEKREEEKKPKSKKRFVPPSLDEVLEYSKTVNFDEPEEFWNFQESKGWMVGKSKMKNWHSSITTWKLRKKKNSTSQQETLNFGN